MEFPEPVRASTISADMLADKDLPGAAINILKKALKTYKKIELISDLLNLKCYTGLLNNEDFIQLKEILNTSKFQITDSLPFNNFINTLLKNKRLIKTRYSISEILKLVEQNNIIKHYLYYNHAKYYATMKINGKAINYIKTIISD